MIILNFKVVMLNGPYFCIKFCINKNKTETFKSSEHNNEKRDGPYRSFGYLSLFSDPLYLAKWSFYKVNEML